MNEKNCTCPSGDGSLRWPCSVHPPEDQEAWLEKDDRVRAWHTVFNTLQEVCPDWTRGPGTGEEKAVAKIRELAARAQQPAGVDEAMVRDAERYRWLREERQYFPASSRHPAVVYVNDSDWLEKGDPGESGFIVGKRMDDLIDAAIAGQQQDGEQDPQCLPTDKNCSVCGSPQFVTPSGMTCENGHGGVPAADENQPD